MNTLLLAKLVEQGRIDWDDPVISHYPDFHLGDDKTTKSVLIRHLVCACAGLPRKDLAWVFNNSPDTPTSAVAAHVLYPDMEMGAAYASCDAGVYF